MSSKKKILIFGPAHPLRGGMATFNQRFAEALQSQGHEVRLVTFSYQYPNFLFPGTTQYSKEAAPDGLNIDVEINSVNPFNWLRVGKKYRDFKPDLVIFRYWMPFMAPSLGSIARLIKKNKHTKIIAITDNITPHEKMPFSKPLTKYFLKGCDAFITMSRAVKEELNTIAEGKEAVYHPHPMYDNFGKQLEKAEAKKALGLDPDFNYLLFFGFIRGYKGLDLTLQSFADSRLRELPLKLIIAGEYYDKKEKYQALIKQLNIEEHLVQRNDFIPNEEVGKYFSACDLVIQTYKNATQSGVSQVAYHFNKPMIVTNVGGLHEFVPHMKVGYVTEKDPKEIADAIIDYYQNNRETAFIEGMQEEKKKYTWESFTQAVLKLA